MASPGIGSSGASLVWQMQRIVDSGLVEEDAKLDLVSDYGSDQTVSHHGKWSMLPSSSDSRRSREIRAAFAAALCEVSGHDEGEATGNPELDSIIGQLRSNSKPLRKREVRKILDKASMLITRAERPLQQGIECVDGTFRISGKWLRNETGGTPTSEIYRKIQTNVLNRIEGFNAWFAGECKARVAEALGVKAGLSETYFNLLWNRGTMNGLADSLRKQLNLRCEGKEEIGVSAEEMKELLVSAQINRIITEESEDLYVNISAAEEKLQTLTGLVENLERDFNQWKVDNLNPIKGVLGDGAFEALERKIDEGYKLLRGVAEGKTLEALATGEGEKRTLFNHLVDFLAKNANADVSLFDVIRDDLNAQVNGYRLVDEAAGTVPPKLPLPSVNQEDPRQRQNEDDSPHAVIANLLAGNPKVGLIQKGGNSCWMISVVNGLLTTPAGCRILQDCFGDPDKCVFKARTNAGETKTIEVTKDEIDALMRVKGDVALSRLEAAIWLGVKAMAEDGQKLFDVRGFPLGAQGEASEAAMLFGLRNVMNDRGKSMDDSDSAWVTGANALRGDKLVVLHRGANTNSGHFLTAVGTDFKAGEEGKEPSVKSFHVHDSLEQHPTTKLTSEQLNVKGLNRGDVYRVQAFEIPEAQQG